jgi:3-isopropylmalate/(R)-2-methylmalate dehydratase small subunit
MQAVTTVTGTMVPLDRADVDTDQIMPKQHLKRIERTGFGEFVFDDWRANPAFVLNDERYAAANVLVTGPNFGSGSSREHAPWGLQQHGFDAIIAPSFADIFRNNCSKIGLLTVVLPPDRCRALIDLATREPAATIRIDLPEQVVVTEAGTDPFEIDPFAKRLLVEGLDPIGLTLARDDEISAFEAERPAFLPVAAG